MIMQRLQQDIPLSSVRLVRDSVSVRFKDVQFIKEPEALILFEQDIVAEERIREALELEYNVKFPEFAQGHVNENVARHFKDSGLVPINFDIGKNEITVGVLPEFKDKMWSDYSNYTTRKILVTIYDYVDLHNKYYGEPNFLYSLSPKDIFNFIVADGIDKGASDITISEREYTIKIYYNINKRVVPSRRSLPKSMMEEIYQLITSQAGASSSFASMTTKHCAVVLTEGYRGRVVINTTYWGKTITIRILSNKLQRNTLDVLNLKDDVLDFIRRRVISLRPGLKIWAGPTMSGKNTTVLAALYELHEKYDAKIVSVENPVEVLTDYIEQINTETDEQFLAAIQSTTRQNPDLIYITEMSNLTAKATMEAGNQGKGVFTTVHSNSVAEVPSRIMDLTGYSIDYIMQHIECIVFQQLVGRICPLCQDKGCPECHKAGMLPVVEYIYITPKLRRELIGQSQAEVYKILEREMKGVTKYDYAQSYIADGIISEIEYTRWLGGLDDYDAEEGFDEE